MKRLLTAGLLIPAVLYLTWTAHPLVFGAITAAIGVLCFREYARLAAGHSMPVSFPIGAVAGVAVVLLPAVDSVILTIPVFAAFALALRNQKLADVLPQTGALTLGLIYCFVPWRCAVSLRHLQPYWLVFALALNWIGDGAAFGIGAWIGRHKLAPRVSPGKSWEGAIASAVASVLFGLAWVRYFAPQMLPWEVVGLSLTANAAGQLGDLCESALKRGAGMKDSGTLLPGHGGWLDRLDSSLFSLPVVYCWLARYSLF